MLYKGRVTVGVNIDNIGIKIIPLFNSSVIIISIFTPNSILAGKFVIKFISIFY